MSQLILKFLQAIFRKAEKQLYSIVDRLGVANLVCFQVRKVVLLQSGPCLCNRGGSQNTTSRQKHFRSKFHGCFSAGGGVAFSFRGRSGNSNRSSSSSIAI